MSRSLGHRLVPGAMGLKWCLFSLKVHSRFHDVIFSYHSGPLGIASAESPSVDTLPEITRHCSHGRTVASPSAFISFLTPITIWNNVLSSLYIVSLLSSALRSMIEGTLPYSVMYLQFLEEWHVVSQYFMDDWRNHLKRYYLVRLTDLHIVFPGN